MNRNPIFCVIVSLMLLSGCSQKPADVAESFVYHIEEGNFESAVDLFSAQVIATFGREKLIRGVKRSHTDMLEKGGVDSFMVISEEPSTDGMSIMLEYEITFKNGERNSSTMDIVKQNGKWKIEPNFGNK